MDIYIVLAFGEVVGASARLQGAELIRATYEQRFAVKSGLCTIVNAELQDTE